MTRQVAVWSLCLTLFFARFSGSQPGDAGREIRGKWRGTSICVDKKTDTACKDEQVLYVFEPAGTSKDSVILHASKMVDGHPEPMGDLPVRYERKTHSWDGEFLGRVRIRWIYEVRDTLLSGTLIELPSGRLIRTVRASRQSAK